MALTDSRIVKLSNMKNVDGKTVRRYLKQVKISALGLGGKNWTSAMLNMSYSAKVNQWNRYTIMAVTAGLLEHFNVL